MYVDSFSHRWVLPKNWIIAAYGEDPTYDIGVVARLPEGALLASPQQ